MRTTEWSAWRGSHRRVGCLRQQQRLPLELGEPALWDLPPNPQLVPGPSPAQSPWAPATQSRLRQTRGIPGKPGGHNDSSRRYSISPAHCAISRTTSGSSGIAKSVLQIYWQFRKWGRSASKAWRFGSCQKRRSGLTFCGAAAATPSSAMNQMATITPFIPAHPAGLRCLRATL